MSAKLDDLEAIRTVVAALQPFEAADQERIIRWAREKLGLGIAAAQAAPPPTPPVPATAAPPAAVPGRQRDLRAFVAEKNPVSDTHFAATVAYYYRFEAPESERKEAVGADDLLDACRKAGRNRLQNPGQTLRNAHRDGLLDRADRGAFRINAVGENLVAMTLPSTGAASSLPAARRSPGRGGKGKASKRS